MALKLIQTIEFDTGTQSEPIINQIVKKGCAGFDAETVIKLDKQFTAIKGLYESKIVTPKQYDLVINKLITALLTHIAEFNGMKIKTVIKH